MSSAPDPNRRLEDLVREALSDPDLPEAAEKLHERFIEIIRDSQTIQGRSILALLLATGFMELMNRAAVSGVQLAGFTVTDLSSIRKVLPAIAAYLIYETITCAVRIKYAKRLAVGLDRAYRPSFHASRLGRFVTPRGSAIFGPLSWHQSDTWSYGMIKFLVATLRALSAIIPFALLVYWYIVLVRAFGFIDPVLWISAVVAGGFTALALLLVIEGSRSDLAVGLLFWRTNYE
ncbi:hypothetical protein I6A60_35085 [Frankia sp. AgB1.9]|uniref:hypothetical protein n=1 Tax=unclassified Frankia TaxID=2632575 RepID=UPI001931E12A|nr:MULTISPECIES: hypothetical protein [unclassified Frankia]MBL7493742.1 hypothetical protein [Frankia sp. AgW1.1]MBL7553037.1 hypothetical protein [Frankia sp. AgB1.9]MBL7620515.1 hypothetical protein [Frankia sp. AgB1.8]